jgi:16S rRNA (adenine1518-N6/adenine1519-N6)-dimethyltransferase
MEFSKLRGQHFLTDKKIVEKIIAASELSPDETVLEVGPGLGALTREILPRVGRLIAVELDPFFAHELRRLFEAGLRQTGTELSPRRLEIIEGDILKMKISDLLNSGAPRAAGYKLITNLPYNITSAFLKKFLIEPPAPERIVIMLQKEVAERIVFQALPATRHAPISLLGLMCNLYAKCSPVCKAPAAAFTPAPKVDSAVIRLNPYSDRAFKVKWGIDRDYAEDVMALAAKFFAQPRKKMCGMVGRARRAACQAALVAIGESPDSRPATLTVEKWVELWKKMR